MSEAEAIEQIKTILKVRKEQKEIIECSGGNCINCVPDIKALEKVLQLLEQKDNKIKELEADLYSANCTINEYIEEINKLKDRLKKDIKDFEYTQFAIRGALDFRNSGRLLEAKTLLDVLGE